MTRRVLTLALLTVLALAAPGAAGAAEPRVSFNDIEDEVMCDTCNVPLNVAEHPRADQEREVIRGLIAQGLTKEEIKSELAERYGPAILALPEEKGFSLAAYLVPLAVVAGLLAALAALVPRWRRRTARGGPPVAAAGPGLSAADARRLDEDLARYDG